MKVMENVPPDLITYVKNEIGLGIPQQKINQTLLEAGWTPEQIAEVFQTLNLPSTLAGSFAPTLGITDTHGSVIKKIIAGSLGSIILIVGAFGYIHFFKGDVIFVPEESAEKNESEKETLVSPFNTQPTMLLDMSPYDIEASEELWSEESYFMFDGEGWSVSLPLVKKGEKKGKIVIGLGEGKTLESSSYGKVVGTGNYLLSTVRGTSTENKKTKYVVEKIENGEKILDTNYVDRLLALLIDDKGSTVTLVENDGWVLWGYDKKEFPIKIATGTLVTRTNDWITLNIYKDGDHVAFPVFDDKKVKIIVSGPEGYKEIYPEWRYEDPISLIRIIKVQKDASVSYMAMGQRHSAFFLNDKEIAGNLDTGTASYLIPLLDTTYTSRGLYAISENGKELALVNNSYLHVGPSSVGESVQLIGESSRSLPVQSKGSRILDLEFSPGGKDIFYKVEENFNGLLDERKVYVVVNEKREGPWQVVKDFFWLEDGGYVYWAEDKERNDVIVKNGTTILKRPNMISTEDHEFSIMDMGVSVNPANGGVLYVLSRSTITQQGIDWESSIVHDGKESRVYKGLAQGMNWGRDFFSSKGKHVVYLVPEENIIVIDGKEYPIDGQLLGAWQGSSGGFSEDERWFGIYVEKQDQIWWVPYELE